MGRMGEGPSLSFFDPLYPQPPPSNPLPQSFTLPSISLNPYQLQLRQRLPPPLFLGCSQPQPNSLHVSLSQALAILSRGAQARAEEVLTALSLSLGAESTLCWQRVSHPTSCRERPESHLSPRNSTGSQTVESLL